MRFASASLPAVLVAALLPALQRASADAGVPQGAAPSEPEVRCPPATGQGESAVCRVAHAISWESGAEAAVALVQTGLRSKRAAAGGPGKVAEVREPTTASAPVPHSYREHLQPKVAACSHMGHEDIPFAMRARAELQIFSELGLIQHDHLHRCLRQSLLSAGGQSEAHSIAQENKVALHITAAWLALSLGLLLWSVYSVARVPSKGEQGEASLKAEELDLANEDKAWESGFLSWVSLSWADTLMGRFGKSSSTVIEEHEMAWEHGTLQTKPYEAFRHHWQEQVQMHGVEGASLVVALYKTVGFKAVCAQVAACLLDLMMSQIVSVVALDKFLRCLEQMNANRVARPEEPQSYLEPTLLIVGVVFVLPMMYRSSSIIASLVDGYYTAVCAGSLGCVVFEKAMDLPAGAAPPREEHGGEADPSGSAAPNVIQILNVDIIECWAHLLKTLVYTVLTPPVILISFIMLIRQIQLAGLIGFFYCVPIFIGTTVVARINFDVWMKYQWWQDQRLKFLTETIMHIRTLKSLALERLALKRITKLRESELQLNQRCTIVGGFNAAIGSTIPWGCMILTLYCAMRFEGSVQAHQILIVQRLLGSMVVIIGLFIQGVHRFIAVPNSFRRIQKFLAQPGRPRGVAQQPSAGDPTAIRLRGSFSFIEEKPPVLKDLQLDIQHGALVAVIGGVASGKSALLQAMIGELYPLAGAHLAAPDTSGGTIAYCAQVPWIFEGTLRDNVLTSSPFEHQRYYKSLYAAALLADLQILPGGDQVSIGSYGIRLSGGQRARVALARAAYMHAEVVILDDPFASVDAPTGQHLMHELLTGPVMEGRTRIVATQPDPGRLRKFDRVILLEAGRVAQEGTPEEVIASVEFARLQATAARTRGSMQKAKRERDTWTFGAETVARVCKDKANDKVDALREREDQDHITSTTLLWWLHAAGYSNLAMFAGVIVALHFSGLLQSLVLARWIDNKLLRPAEEDHVYLLQLIFWTAINSALTVLLMWAASRVSISASGLLHAEIMDGILCAPIDRFFDKQPQGRLLNRLSFDMRQVDDAVPWVLSKIVSFVVGVCVTQCFILNILPWSVAICAVPFFGTALFFIVLYKNTTVPLVFHCKFTLSAAQDLQAVVLTSSVSIRANAETGSLMGQYLRKASTLMRSNYMVYHVCTAWAQSRVFLCFAVLTTIFAMSGLWSGLEMGTLSIVISLSLNMMMEFENLSFLFTHGLTIMNALQRLAQYLKIPQEAPKVMPGDPAVRFSARVERSDLVAAEVRLAAGVPTGLFLTGDSTPLFVPSQDLRALVLHEGRSLREMAPSCQALRGIDGTYDIVAVNSVSKDAALMAEELCNPAALVWIDFWHRDYVAGMRIQLEDLTAGYNNEKPVLQSISLDIPPRMKVGFAGRTGSGKSTAFLCILRILEPRSGRILIGDMDISKMGLTLLRTMVGLVPQDATVFEGSWRYNIDPFGEFPDGKIWEALRCSRLLEHVRALAEGLDSLVTRDGSNLSAGQRQLLSLARMVIRQPPVLLLDECTSALDPLTQHTVQETVLNEFPLSTVIAIAHRVETILEFDRIVVFDTGRVAEHGTVKKVMGIEQGIFAAMVEAAKH